MNKIEIDLKSTEEFKVPDLILKKYEIFSSQIRLSVMLILLSYEKVKIVELQKAFNISSGKLEHHLNALETEGLLRKNVDLSKTRVLKSVEVTENGKKLLLEYLEKMKETLENVKSEDK